MCWSPLWSLLSFYHFCAKMGHTMPTFIAEVCSQVGGLTRVMCPTLVTVVPKHIIIIWFHGRLLDNHIGGIFPNLSIYHPRTHRSMSSAERAEELFSYCSIIYSLSSNVLLVFTLSCHSACGSPILFISIDCFLGEFPHTV